MHRFYNDDCLEVSKRIQDIVERYNIKFKRISELYFVCENMEDMYKVSSEFGVEHLSHLILFKEDNPYSLEPIYFFFQRLKPESIYKYIYIKEVIKNEKFQYIHKL